jgi:hypothetical protein
MNEMNDKRIYVRKDQVYYIMKDESLFDKLVKWNEFNEPLKDFTTLGIKDNDTLYIKLKKVYPVEEKKEEEIREDGSIVTKIRRSLETEEIEYEIVCTKYSLGDERLTRFGVSREKFIDFSELCDLICDHADWWFPIEDE